MRKEELLDLAKDIHLGLVFTDRHIRKEDENLVRIVFMPVVFGALKDTDVEKIGMVYEYHSKSLQRNINGYPCFMSMQILDLEEAEYVWQKVKALEEATKSVGL